MTSFRASSRVVGACAASVLVMSACGSGATEPSAAASGEIASLESETATSTADAAVEDVTVSADEAALAFSQCLRDEGLDVADIGVDADGNIDLRSAFDGIDRGDTGVRDAMDACRDILGDVGFGGGRGANFDQSAVQDAFLEFSDCIRGEGFEDVPDLSFQAPGGGGPGGNGPPEGSVPVDGSVPPRGEGQRPGGFGDRNTFFAQGLGLDPEDPAVIAALDTCSPLLDTAFGGGPGAAAPAGG